VLTGWRSWTPEHPVERAKVYCNEKRFSGKKKPHDQDQVIINAGGFVMSDSVPNRPI
jgi:hypothetical protein